MDSMTTLIGNTWVEESSASPLPPFPLNNLAEDFGKRFVPQQELSAEQKFWLQSSDKNSEKPSTSNTPVKIEVLSEVPKFKDFFNEFDKGLLDEITEVQTVFTQMEAAVEQYSNENSVDTCNKCLELEVGLVNKNDVYIELLKRFSNLEQHCISFEVAKKLNKEIFQKDKSSNNQNHPEIQEYFEQNDLKAQLQAQDTVISKLKETVHSLKENANPAKSHKEKEHLKKTYKELYDSIKPSRVHAKEQCHSLIANLNSKSMENADLKTQIEEKVFANAALKNELRKLKGKNVIDTVVSKPYATTIAP
ncbi:hypothetical protein Tco_0599390 [Tanacetum coccineum]